MALVATRELHDAVYAALDAVSNVNTFDGEVTAPPLDPDGRVHAYAVLYMAPGALFASSLTAQQASMLGSFQVTCVGGDPTRTLWCVDKVRTALVGATITVAGRQLQIRASEFSEPGPVRRDDDVSPVRHYVPLDFSVFVP